MCWRAWPERQSMEGPSGQLAIVSPTERAKRVAGTRRVPILDPLALEHEWALSPLRLRGIERVRPHADLRIVAKLSCALARRGGGTRRVS